MNKRNSSAETAADKRTAADSIPSASLDAKRHVRRSLLIHFTDTNVCLDDLQEQGIEISFATEAIIRETHTSVRSVIPYMPQKLIPDICFRAANFIIDTIWVNHNVSFAKYKKSDYELV